MGQEAIATGAGEVVLDPWTESAHCMWLRGGVEGGCGFRGLHVADVEQAGLLAGPVVRVSYTEVAVLDGHGVAAKGDELRAMLGVEVI